MQTIFIRHRKSRRIVFFLHLFVLIFTFQSRFHSVRPVKKCSFNIESLLELKTNENQISNRSYVDDTEDGSSDDGHTTSFRSPPISSYALFNQLKTLDMTINKPKNDLTRKNRKEINKNELFRFSSFIIIGIRSFTISFIIE